jgi:hypothetical protein
MLELLLEPGGAGFTAEDILSTIHDLLVDGKLTYPILDQETAETASPIKTHLRSFLLL